MHAGYKSAALLVVQGFYYEWHEDSYHIDVSKYVVTPIKVDKEAERQSGAHGSDAVAPRISTPHVSIWDDVASGRNTSSAAKPSIVILTYASAVYGEIMGPTSEWRRCMANLVGWDSIGAVIVDETSQLWAGHALSLLPRYSKAKHFILVGDEQQLPPFGSDDQKNGAKSLFDCAISHKDVPVQLHDTSYRLPTTIGDILSEFMYRSKLQIRRNETVDAMVRRILRAGLPHAPAYSRTFGHASYTLTSNLIDYTSGQHTLSWLHVEGTAAQNTESKSTFNQAEAEATAAIAADILAALRLGEARVPHAERATALGAAMGLASTDADLDEQGEHDGRLRLCIITPYEAQRSMIEDKLADHIVRMEGRERGDALRYVRSSKFVNSVDGYQGQEADIVLVSLARDKRIGFLKDNRRVNVMLSRCQHAMIVVGNVHLWEGFGPEKYLISRVAQKCLDNALCFKMSADKLLMYSHNSRPAMRAPAPAAVTAARQTITFSNPAPVREIVQTALAHTRGRPAVQISSPVVVREAPVAAGAVNASRGRHGRSQSRGRRSQSRARSRSRAQSRARGRSQSRAAAAPVGRGRSQSRHHRGRSQSRAARARSKARSFASGIGEDEIREGIADILQASDSAVPMLNSVIGERLPSELRGSGKLHAAIKHDDRFSTYMYDCTRFTTWRGHVDDSVKRSPCYRTAQSLRPHIIEALMAAGGSLHGSKLGMEVQQARAVHDPTKTYSFPWLAQHIPEVQFNGNTMHLLGALRDHAIRTAGDDDSYEDESSDDDDDEGTTEVGALILRVLRGADGDYMHTGQFGIALRELADEEGVHVPKSRLMNRLEHHLGDHFDRVQVLCRGSQLHVRLRW